MGTPTLLEDLEQAAIEADELARDSSDVDAHDDYVDFAARLREHASRLRTEMERATELRDNPKATRTARYGSACVVAGYERINGGPAKE